MQRAARRQIATNVAPLTARAQNTHDTVQHLPDVDVAPSPARPGGRDQALNLLSRAKSTVSLKNRRKLAGWNVD
jgi:hypothetical protein